MFQLLIFIMFTETLSQNPSNPYIANMGLDTGELLKKFGYPVEVHYVTSDDGYITALHRIPHGLSKDRAKRPAMLIVPGLTASSAEYINMGPNTSIGCILADNGMDVWISNNRGATWSRNHTHLDPDVDIEEFWDFSWHEIGYYDIPAMIDYILKLNGDDSLFYIGHSQGTTAFMAFGASRPEYNKKIRLAGMFAPSIAIKYVSSPLVNALASNSQIIYNILQFFNIHELSPNGLLNRLRRIVSYWVMIPENQKFVTTIMNKFGFIDVTQFDPARLPVILSNTPAGGSVKEFLHYAQLYKSKSFKFFDYGYRGNLIKYGTKKAPLYNLSAITAPIAMYYANHDTIISVKEVQEIIQQLPNVANDYLVPFAQFNHIDFATAIDAPKLVYKEVLKDIEKYR